MTTTAKLFFSLAFLNLFSIFTSCAADRPNFIVIMVDDMGYAGLSCFGNPYFKTPELDRLAAEGMKFTDFHSSGTVCSPTRAGLLTGRYQQRSGIEAVIHPVSDLPEHRKGLQLSEVTFAGVLKDAGYHTGIIGKWHQGYPHNSPDYHPQNHGFDEFFGYHSGNIDFVSHVGDHYKHDWWHGKKETNEEGYATDLINQHADQFVRKYGKKEEPFCLYIAHLAIHNPIQVQGDPVRRTEDEWKRWDWKKHTEDERADKLKGMTLPIDDGLGALRKTLDEMGIAENTFILFFTDNGGTREIPSSSPELRAWKGSVYEGGHRVPAIACWPGKIPAGTVSDETLISIDIMPTLLSIAGAKLPDRKLDGVDFSQVLFEQKSIAKRPLYWASLGNNGSRTEAMRDGPWKLVVKHPGAKVRSFDNEKVELYNLSTDLRETTDLADAHPQKTKKMLAGLKAWFQEVTQDATPQPSNP
ncbi:MAG: sulfatase-like hydrolase/transferase [Verrucomicrobiales bacterium]|nr:sulfatase-like hydrolase/transferase [Verrucomicrobiales bacterium]